MEGAVAGKEGPAVDYAHFPVGEHFLKTLTGNLILRRGSARNKDTPVDNQEIGV